MSSIREVAKLAGVSPATVSRVINGTANVEAEKKERVLRAISETGFRPNEVARSLFKKSAKMIGLIIPSIQNPFFTQMSSAIEKTAEKYGYRLILCNTMGDLKKEKNAISMLSSMNADGIILTTSNEKIRTFLNKCEIPIVTMDRLISKNATAGYIHCDHYEGGRIAAQHLIDCGCKNIVCVRGPKDISSAKERYAGYRDVCKEQNMIEQTVECDYDFNAGLTAAEELLKRYPKVDGIIACNDMVAISIYKILHKKKIRVPEEVQLIGYDNVYISTLVSPELTTVAQPIEEIGVKAAELLIHKEENREKEFVFHAQLVVRETTMNKKGE